MAKTEILTPAELGRIETAVRDAEARTRGEIYCVVAEASSDYGETPLAWAAGVALLAPLALLVWPYLFDGGWAAQGLDARRALVSDFVLQGLLFVAVGLVAAIPAVRLRLTPRALKRERVLRRAREQFTAKNLHLTRERTGVLIFVSMAEHMAELIADEGIAAKVEPAVWDLAMATLTAGLKRGEAAEGFVGAVGLCAGVLAEHFPCDPGDNPNELSDAVVLLPRI